MKPGDVSTILQMYTNYWDQSHPHRKQWEKLFKQEKPEYIADLIDLIVNPTYDEGRDAADDQEDDLAEDDDDSGSGVVSPDQVKRLLKARDVLERKLGDYALMALHPSKRYIPGNRPLPENRRW